MLRGQTSIAPSEGQETVEPVRPSPVSESARIDAIDVVRGFALIGIFMVNIAVFGDAFGKFLDPTPPAGASTTDLICRYFVKAFCEGKFYPLFSLLFGIGIALQWERAQRTGRPFFGVGLRRLAVLAILGLVHGLLLWYGDVLFIYSITGLLLLLLIRFSARTLAILGGVFLGIGVIFGTAAGGLGALQELAASEHTEGATLADGHLGTDMGVESDTEPGFDGGVDLDTESGGAEPNETDDADAGPSTPISRALAVMNDPSQMEGAGGPLTARAWLDAEREAYRDGPFVQAFFFRAISFAAMLVFSAFSFWWNVAAMFLLGAALTKAGLFAPGNLRWHRRLAVVGLGIGIPAGLLAAFLIVIAPMWVFMLVSPPLTMLGGPLLSLGYLGAITLLVHAGRARLATSALAKVGRMALTNYLLQTVVATAIFYHWGLGLFGDTTATQRVGLVAGIYAAQVIFSVLWLQWFRFGPMEWIWRSLTYLRPQPLLRSSAPPRTE